MEIIMKTVSVEKYQRKLLRKIAYNTFFTRTFIMTMMLVIAISSLFLLYVFSVENKGLRNATLSSYHNAINSEINATETALLSIQNLMGSTLEREDFTSALVTPEINNYNRVSNIVKRLHSIVEENPLIKNAFLYVPHSDMVYTSDLAYIQRNKCGVPYFQDVSFFMDKSGIKLEKGSNDTIFLKKYGKKFLAIKHFFPINVNSIGALIFEIDTECFQPNNKQGGESYYILAADGDSVFYSQIPQEIKDVFVRINNHIEFEKDSIVFSYSGYTGWTYILSGDMNYDSLLPLQKAIRGILPILVVGFVLAGTLAILVDKPMQKLMENLRGGPGIDVEDAQNEVDYIEKAYKQSTNRNTVLVTKLHELTPFVLERIFNQIINGKMYSEDEMSAVFNSIGKPFPEGTCYFAMMLEFVGKASDNALPMPIDFDMQQLRRMVIATLPDGYTAYFNENEDSHIIIVYAMPEITKVSDFHDNIRKIIKGIESLQYKSSYYIHVGNGNVYEDIRNIRYSVLEAAENLNREKFYGIRSDPVVQSRYFRKLERIVQKAEYAFDDQAEKESCSLIDEIFKENQEVDQIVCEYNHFLTTLIEVANDTHLVNGNDLEIRKDIVIQECYCIKDNKELIREKVISFCNNLIGLLSKKNNRKVEVYIIQVKDYVSQNYNNSSLSLDMIADKIGLSRSYLSRIFNEELHISLVDYINSIRIEKSMELLKNTDILIRDIAYQTGFNSQSSFFRIFKKYTNISPGEYRKTNKV